MKGPTKRTRAGSILAVAGALIFGSGQLLHRTREPVNMPISLAVGHVTTPEFKVIKDRYIILVVAKKRLPFDALCCMMGIGQDQGPLNCHKEPLVQANWTVSSDHHVVAQGASHGAGGGGSFSNRDVARYLGDFYGEAGKKYTLDVEFIKDATALAVTDPHLSVQISNASYLAP